MRLLHTSNLSFREFFDAETPKYTIASHRWTHEEITHEQFLAGSHKTGYGYEKITELCEISKQNGFEWCWIDTVCIDKRSSSELSEAINSMFKWYERSQVCYVFLRDVALCGCQRRFSVVGMEAVDEMLGDHEREPCPGGECVFEKRFRGSEWWTRGWTLQELIAPPSLHFYDKSYTFLGERRVYSELIHQITGIRVPEGIPGDTTPTRHNSIVRDIPFATKMSWVSRRKTSRSEDLAYCMLGLFDIYMSLLYGEGIDQAFMRLQTEFLLRKGDDSVFVWNRAQNGIARPFPLLARSPQAFTGLVSTAGLNLSLGMRRSLRGVVTTFGLELELPVPEVLAKTGSSAPVLYELATWTKSLSDTADMSVPIFLKVVLEPRAGNIWQGRLDPQVILSNTDLYYADSSKDGTRIHRLFGEESEPSSTMHDNGRPVFVFRRDQRFNDSVVLDPMTRSQKAKACQESSWWRQLRYSSKKVISRRVAFQQDPRREITSEATTKLETNGPGLPQGLSPKSVKGYSMMHGGDAPGDFQLYSSPAAAYPRPDPGRYSMYQGMTSMNLPDEATGNDEPWIEPGPGAHVPQGPYTYRLYEAPHEL